MPELIPNRNHFIALETASEMTARYRERKNSILSSSFREENILPLCETFNRDAFDVILGNMDCVGIRFYYSMDSKLCLHAIIVGVNADNEDILPTGVGEEEPARLIIENGLRCPVDCPPASPLNS